MRLPAEVRRRQLLEVGREVFAAKGFHATSMDDVAVAAGVTKPVLYQHFSSKRALYVELLEEVGAELLAAIGSATTRATTGREQVEFGFQAYFRFVTENRSSFRLLFGASVRNDAEFARLTEQVIEEIARAISTLIDVEATAEHRRVLAHSLVGIAEATSRRVLTSPDAEAEPEKLARWLAEMAWFGLRGVRSDDETGDASVTRLRDSD